MSEMTNQEMKFDEQKGLQDFFKEQTRSALINWTLFTAPTGEQWEESCLNSAMKLLGK